MKMLPPTELRMQCPSCGHPVELLDARADQLVTLGPCGHEFTVAELSVVA